MSFQYGDKYCRLGHFVMGELTTDEEYLALWDDVDEYIELASFKQMHDEYSRRHAAMELRKRHVEMGS
jgi:hypothetical protein